MRILHAPNHRGIKGTSYIVRAVEELQAEGVPIELELIEFASNDEVLAAMAAADLVVDQLVIGWYAMFALEAMSMAKPVVCFLRPDLVDFYIGARLLEEGELPLIGATVRTVKDVLRDCVARRADLPDIGRRSQAYVRRRHSLEAVGGVFDRINRSLGVVPQGQPNG